MTRSVHLARPDSSSSSSAAAAAAAAGSVTLTVKQH